MSIEKAVRQQTLNNLLPRPRALAPEQSDYVLRPNERITLSVPVGGELFAALHLQALLLQEYGLFCHLDILEDGGWTLAIGTKLGQRTLPLDDLPTEGYALQATAAGAAVQARTAVGLYWGAMTLRQLVVPRDKEHVICGATIRDWPRYPWRGFMVDAGRSPCSLAQLERIIRIAASLKLNCLVYREGDDELNAVRYRRNPLGSLNPWAIPMDQIAELIEYAAQHHIALIPEIESLGHSTAKGLHYPELVGGGFRQAYGETLAHVRKSHLNPADPRSYALLRSIYDEWLPILPTPLLHLGLDEVRLPLEMQAEHLARLLPLLDRVAAMHDCQVQPIVWADAPATPDAYAQRVIRCIWGYDNRPVSDQEPHLVRQGIRELSAPSCSTPVLMAGGSGSKHEPYTKGDYAGAFENLANWARWGADKKNWLGLIAVQWHGNMLDQWLPDFAAVADYSWHPPATLAFEREMARVKAQLARLPDAVDPDPTEVDPHAWDGIWLLDGDWGENVAPMHMPEDAAPSP